MCQTWKGNSQFRPMHASNTCMGIQRSQGDNRTGEEHPILYLSKKFLEVEKQYSTTECQYARDRRKFKVVTDHNTLKWLRTNVSSNPRLMRWALALQPYDMEIIHKAGKNNKNAYSLSKIK